MGLLIDCSIILGRPCLGLVPAWSLMRRASLSRFFFQAEDGIRDLTVTGVQTCALPIFDSPRRHEPGGRRVVRSAGQANPRFGTMPGTYPICARPSAGTCLTGAQLPLSLER